MDPAELIDEIEQAYPTPEESCKAVWKVSIIAQEDLIETLETITGEQSNNYHIIFRLDHIKQALQKILNKRKNDKAISTLLLGAMEASEAEIKEWLKEFHQTGINHPELWLEVSRFLGRILRGELYEISEHPNFEQATGRLVELLSPDKPLGSVWIDAWKKQKKAFLVCNTTQGELGL